MRFTRINSPGTGAGCRFRSAADSVSHAMSWGCARVFASAVQAAAPLRDDALGADLAHGLEQLPADAVDMVDTDDPLAPGRADHVAQQRLAVLDRPSPQIVPVEVQ